MKKIVSILSGALLVGALTSCSSYEGDQVEVEAGTSTSTSTSIKSEARTKITIEQFEWDKEIVCRPRPDGMFSAYWDDGSHQGYSRAESWDVVCNDYYEPVTLDVRVVPAKG